MQHEGYLLLVLMVWFWHLPSKPVTLTFSSAVSDQIETIPIDGKEMVRFFKQRVLTMCTNPSHISVYTLPLLSHPKRKGLQR
jgi:hypothetical protein